MNRFAVVSVVLLVAVIVLNAFARPTKTWRLAVDLTLTAIVLNVLMFGLPLLLNARSTAANVLGAGILLGIFVGVVSVFHKKFIKISNKES